MTIQKPLALRGFATPVFAVVSALHFCCRLPKTVEMGKMNNEMLHFPSHLFVKLSLGNSRKLHILKFTGGSGEGGGMPPDPL